MQSKELCKKKFSLKWSKDSKRCSQPLFVAGLNSSASLTPCFLKRSLTRYSLPVSLVSCSPLSSFEGLLFQSPKVNLELVGSQALMLSTIRSRSINLLPQAFAESWFPGFFRTLSTSGRKLGLLDLQEVGKVLSEVKADDVKVIPVSDRCDWTDFMVIATGRSNWHVKNIAQALIYKAKQKQKAHMREGIDQLMLPSVVGQEGGKWIVIDNGNMVIHALEEKARAYYDLDSLWTTEMPAQGPDQELEKSLVRIRRKNNSKKRAQESVPS